MNKARFLNVNNEFYKIESINNNIVVCFQYSDDYANKNYFTFDLSKIKYELWQ